MDSKSPRSLQHQAVRHDLGNMPPGVVANVLSKASDDQLVIAEAAPFIAGQYETGIESRLPRHRYEEVVAVVPNCRIALPTQRLGTLPL